jgi:hypothetical protein
VRAAITAAVVAVGLLASDAGAKCALQVLDSEIITHAGDEIPANGGVLVGWTTSHDRGGRIDGTDPVIHPAWKFREKKKLMRAVMTQLAPGLAAYAPKVTRNKKHTVVLKGDSGKTLGTYKIAKQNRKWVAHPAPGIKTVTRTVTEGFRGGDEISINVTLDAAPPADAYALIAYDASDVALTWRPILDPAATAIVVYDSPGHCGTEPPGMRPPGAGDSITFAWVDKFGRLSARSAAATVWPCRRCSSGPCCCSAPARSTPVRARGTASPRSCARSRRIRSRPTAACWSRTASPPRTSPWSRTGIRRRTASGASAPGA